MENKYSNFTILLTGRLSLNNNHTFLNYIEHYLTYVSKIILVIWDDDEIPERLKNILKNNTEKIKIVGIRYNEEKPGEIKHQTFLKLNTTVKYQLFTIIKGIKLCDTEYVIRMRFDTGYKDFKILLDYFIENKKKIIFSNIYFKKVKSVNNFPHIGDFLILSKTSILKDAFEEFYNLRLIENKKHPDHNHYIVIEFLMSYYLLKHQYLEYNDKDLFKDMLDENGEILEYEKIKYLNYQVIEDNFSIFDLDRLSTYEYRGVKNIIKQLDINFLVKDMDDLKDFFSIPDKNLKNKNNKLLYI